MSLRIFASRLVQHGRRFFAEVVLKKQPVLRIANKLPTHEAVKLQATADAHQASSFAQRCRRWFVNTPAAEFRRNAAKRLMYGGKKAVPYLGFVGINLVSGHGLITKEDELESICEEIRVCLGAINWKKYDFAKKEISLHDLEIGPVIAKGCNAIVHEGKWKNEVNEGETTPIISLQEVPVNITGDGDHRSASEQLITKFDKFDLALKMMFNYSAESNATTILKAMNRETVPAQHLAINEHDGLRIRKKELPPHPNIVTMHCAFADRVPALPGGRNLYPDALPTRLYELGSGRNMTLFLVMQRYHTSLQEYLRLHEPSPTTRVLLLAQLLEGVEHMVRNKIAHRDLKLDNILLDLSQGLDNPRLVISDFGCCLADDYLGLKLPFTSDEVDRGGNCVLMAPEVSTAIPGVLTIIDYSRSDLWAAATLAYDIFGNENPFYGNGLPLDSRFYAEDQLPTLLSAPSPLQRLVQNMLKRNPRERPSPQVAANVCHLLLWGPQALIAAAGKGKARAKDVMEWLCNEAAMSFSQGVADLDSTVICMIRNTFLRRVHIKEVQEALTYFDNQ